MCDMQLRIHKCDQQHSGKLTQSIVLWRQSLRRLYRKADLESIYHRPSTKCGCLSSNLSYLLCQAHFQASQVWLPHLQRQVYQSQR